MHKVQIQPLANFIVNSLHLKDENEDKELPAQLIKETFFSVIVTLSSSSSSTSVTMMARDDQLTSVELLKFRHRLRIDLRLQ